MVSPGSNITKADLDALAALANAKLAPAVPYSFAAFAGKDKLGLPTDINITQFDSNAGGWGPGVKLTFYLYAYKSINGTRTYTWNPLVKAYTFVPSPTNTFGITWTWQMPGGATAPDGFIIMVPQPVQNGWIYYWQDVGNLTQISSTDPGFSTWFLDESLIPAAQLGFDPAIVKDLPCGHGIWLKTLNTIHNDLFTGLDIFGGGAHVFGDTWKVSGPWCVSSAPKCYLNFEGPPQKPAYKNLQFYYSPADPVIAPAIAGNYLSSEADLATFIGAANGANQLTFDTSGTISGTLTLFTNAPNQTAADWTLTASDPSITTSINPQVQDFFGVFTTGLIFTFNNTPVTAAVALTLTATPLTGGSVENPGNPGGGGAQLQAVLTGTPAAQPQVVAAAIHYAGDACMAVSLAETLPNINLTTAIGGANAFEAHWRCFCNGVFVANTLPTLGVMPFLDNDLPNYSPPHFGPGVSASSRRAPLLAVQPAVDNRGALWPVFRDTDFTPDSLLGRPVKGSTAWQVLGTKYVDTVQHLETIPSDPFGLASGGETGPLNFDQELRLLIEDPNVKMYFRWAGPPEIFAFDFILPGGQWNILNAATPGWPAHGNWHVRFFNNTGAEIDSSFVALTLQSTAAPTGTFFATQLDDARNVAPQLEGFSYHFDNLQAFDARPIPQFGYCVFSITARRLPGANGIAPSAGAPALNVDLGLMPGFGFDAAGAFQKIQTITIPANSASVTVPVFLPVVGGTPLAYQCPQPVFIRASVNFQPMVHSNFDPHTTTINSQSVNVGFYSGAPFFREHNALFFPDGSFISSLGVLLPIAATIYTDLQAILNLL